MDIVSTVIALIILIVTMITMIMIVMIKGWRIIFRPLFFSWPFFFLSPAGCGAVSAGCKAAPLSGMGTWRAEGSEF